MTRALGALCAWLATLAGRQLDALDWRVCELSRELSGDDE